MTAVLLALGALLAGFGIGAMVTLRAVAGLRLTRRPADKRPGGRTGRSGRGPARTANQAAAAQALTETTPSVQAWNVPTRPMPHVVVDLVQQHTHRGPKARTEQVTA